MGTLLTSCFGKEYSRMGFGFPHSSYHVHIVQFFPSTSPSCCGEYATINWPLIRWFHISNSFQVNSPSLSVLSALTSYHFHSCWVVWKYFGKHGKRPCFLSRNIAMSSTYNRQQSYENWMWMNVLHISIQTIYKWQTCHRFMQ